MNDMLSSLLNATPDHSGGASRVADSASKQFAEKQQQNLLKQRVRFHSQVDGAYETLESGILGKTHTGDWDSGWYCWGAINKLAAYQHCNLAITLCGWHPTPTSTTQSPPPKHLLFHLNSYRLCFELKKHLDCLDAAGSDAAKLELHRGEVERLFKGRPDVFKGLKLNDGWDRSIVQTYYEEKHVQLLSLIEHEFHFLSDQIFWFLPGTKDSRAGWNMFMSFTNFYDHLPRNLVDGHGPYTWNVFRCQPKT